jgi:hypothetical protein
MGPDVLDHRSQRLGEVTIRRGIGLGGRVQKVRDRGGDGLSQLGLNVGAAVDRLRGVESFIALEHMSPLLVAILSGTPTIGVERREVPSR